MGELFDRNVHPLYAVMAFVCAGIVLILLQSQLEINRKEKKTVLQNFLGFIILYCFQDGVWGLLASGIINSDSGLMVASAVFHVSSALAPFIWTLFFCGTLKELIRKPRIWRTIAAVLMLVQLGMIIANFSSHFMFYVDESGNYQTTDARAILFFCSSLFTFWLPRLRRSGSFPQNCRQDIAVSGHSCGSLLHRFSLTYFN